MYNVQCFLVIVNSWIVTVRSVHSNVTKIHSKLPAAMDEKIWYDRSKWKENSNQCYDTKCILE